jgi:hypothetical protein
VKFCRADGGRVSVIYDFGGTPSVVANIVRQEQIA